MKKIFLSECFAAEGFTIAKFVRDINFVEQHTTNLAVDLKNIEVTAICDDDSPGVLTVVSMKKLSNKLGALMNSQGLISISEKECYHFPKNKIDKNVLERIYNKTIKLVLLYCQGEKRTPIFLDESARSQLVDKLKGRGDVFYTDSILAPLALQGLIDGLNGGKVSNLVLKKVDNTIVLTAVNKPDVNRHQLFFSSVEKLMDCPLAELKRYKISNHQYMIEFEIGKKDGLSYRVRYNQTSSGCFRRYLTVANDGAVKSAVIRELLPNEPLMVDLIADHEYKKNAYQLLADNKKVVIALGRKRLDQIKKEAQNKNSVTFLLSLLDRYNNLVAGEELLAKGIGEIIA